jgi:tRNA A-37 threonylcarbamoyl transferase component Bud32
MAARRSVHLIAWVSSSLHQGDVLAEKYRVTHILAEGGMGIVVAAEHLKLEQRVALKFMLPAVARNPEAVARFLQEARAAAQLQSDHVARILDVCELESGVPYIVMEYLEGHDLGALIQRAGRAVPVDDAVDYVLQACEAIAEAHAVGIVHRDLKPENLFLTRRRGGKPWIKVLDFGISKVLEGSRETGAKVITRDVMGSPAYMSPEQMRSTGEVDGRTDIWSLGVILYELLSKRQPFEGRSIAEICLAVTQREPTALAELRPDVPAELALVVHKCLAKNREERFASVSELVRALAPFAPTRSQASIASVIGLGSAVEDTLDLTPAPPTARTRGAPGTTGRGLHLRGPFFALAGVVLMTAVGVGVGASRSARAKAQAASVAAGVTASEPPPSAAAAPAPERPSVDQPSPVPTVAASAEVAPVLVEPPKPTVSAPLHKSGEPPLVGPASKGRRLITGEPLQAQASKRAPAPEAAKSSDEDVFSARK